MSSYSLPKINKQEQNVAFSSILIKLLQGFVVSDEKKYWESLLVYQEAIREYFSALGLQLHLSIDDGYAFLKQGRLGQHQEWTQEEGSEDGEAVMEGEEATLKEDPTSQIPTLVRRIPLSFEVSLL